jgi:hypothetical protein
MKPMVKVKVPFDLKIGKLQGLQWERKDFRKLAEQLMQNQGSYRYSLENRLFILFDKSTTSSTTFLKWNEVIILREIMKMLEKPENYWFTFNINGQKMLSCIILIPQEKYVTFCEESEPTIGKGMREDDKAKFAHQILTHINWVSNGQIEPYNNPKEHGIDGYIFLPEEITRGD